MHPESTGWENGVFALRPLGLLWCPGGQREEDLLLSQTSLTWRTRIQRHSRIFYNGHSSKPSVCHRTPNIAIAESLSNWLTRGSQVRPGTLEVSHLHGFQTCEESEDGYWPQLVSTGSAGSSVRVCWRFHSWHQIQAVRSLCFPRIYG
jgi:hypothetical protein